MPKKNQMTPKNQEMLTRTINFTRESIIDEESRLVRLSFSSEEPVARNSFFSEPWVEVLGHERSEADLERLNNSAPLLYNHDRSERDNRIGVVERAWLENGRGYAEVRLSKRSEVEGIWQDVKDGILRNVSVSYKINERELAEENKEMPDTYRVTSWTPMEISLVDIPADATVGIGRSDEEITPPTHLTQPNQEERTMPKKLENVTTPESVNADAERKTAIDEGARLALESEKQRRTEIRSIFDNHTDHVEVRDKCLDDPDVTTDQARKLLLDSGAAPSAATVGAGRKAMRTQKDGVATLNISPTFLLVPAALEDTAKILMMSETDPSQANSRKPNPVRNAAEIIIDARLDAASATAWYLLADPNRFDTIEVGYLDGVAAPFLDQQDGWNIDGVEYKVRIDAAAAPLEHRTMYKNGGA